MIWRRPLQVCGGAVAPGFAAVALPEKRSTQAGLYPKRRSACAEALQHAGVVDGASVSSLTRFIDYDQRFLAPTQVIVTRRIETRSSADSGRRWGPQLSRIPVDGSWHRECCAGPP